ncbi:hypothetical protein RGUI_0098 (plasmid) [Rhodovulum sp. P5]|uniref:helix-turn-helix domain-containing protein n=1 Tax=Rhodovulum sp. P5 TaxID=1564506 RepID=UPI0009C2B6AB|nr:helix-turn-helix transcriptional regulator [Rhodovulum sp. P5]ARE42456.1 hypothetical protein RGUI_0098 [Rhodovulum sp. P5]
MAGTAHSPEYRRFVDRLVTARKEAGLSQARLAARLGKPPSFVAKYELSERRLDVLEFVILCRAMEVDPQNLFDALLYDLPDDARI